ncbi:MAG: hypothetical protein ABEH43_09405 [Flavobacteriales bacterium]
MVKKGAFIFVLFISYFMSTALFAQKKNDFKRDGIIKASLTITPGIMLEKDAINSYLHGFLEYYPEKSISLRGEAYFYTGDDRKMKMFEWHHFLLFGGVYHFGEGRFDTFIGLEPGISITKINTSLMSEKTDIVEPDPEVIPLITVSTGVNYYISNFFHVFLSFHYINGTLHNSLTNSESIDEIRISGGLGFNLDLKN